MSWLSRVRSGIPFLPKRQSTENLWHKCGKCGTMVFVKEWEENYSVCPRCNFHDRIGPPKRFQQLFDAAQYEILPAPEVREDPLRFKDSKRYTDRLKAARSANGERDALVNARGKLDGHKVIVGVQDFAFMGGSMGIAVGATLLAGVRAAIADKCPYILFTAAGGARMQEGILSLMQMPRTTVALAELKEAGIPYIVVLTDPTTGGVTASYAMLGDVQIAEPGALIGFAGQRVIEQTIREKLPEGFQRAEYLLEHGMIDMVVWRGDLKEKLALLVAYLGPDKKLVKKPEKKGSRLMADFARSTDPGVQAQLDRLAKLSPAGDRLGLDRIAAMLDRLGRPQDRLPPVFHVAGTNGKGSTVAFIRAALQAAGHEVHVFTSPHLVRFNERIRVAGRLIDDATLAALLAEAIDAGEGLEPSFFEVATAAAFLAFARTPAAACLLEVGLGGRLDATNVIDQPLVTGIANLALDHQQFLGDRLRDIAREKAAIAKPDVPLVTQLYPPAIGNRIAEVAHETGARWLPRGNMWDASVREDRLRYHDERGELDLPLPRLHGRHQALNAGLAVAMLRHQDKLRVPASAWRAAMGWADWPARLQHLADGPLTRGREVWLDGAHNPSAARQVAIFARKQFAGRPFHLAFACLTTKDPLGILEPFAKLAARVHCVPIPGHACFAPSELVESAAIVGIPAESHDSVEQALAAVPADTPAMILGSLYLAGTVLAANGEVPD